MCPPVKLASHPEHRRERVSIREDAHTCTWIVIPATELKALTFNAQLGAEYLTEVPSPPDREVDRPHNRLRVMKRGWDLGPQYFSF